MKVVEFRTKTHQKMSKKSKKNSSVKKSSSPEPIDAISDACEGLVYISETDAPLVPFSFIADDDEIKTAIAKHFAINDPTPTETISFDSFFASLIAVRPGQDEKRRLIADRFEKLKRLMTRSLTDLVVIRSGEIRIDIYVAGRTGDGSVAGFKTRSVET